MCDWFLRQLEEDAEFLSSVMFSDQANFYVKGEVNRQNVRYWSDTNPHWFTDNKQQGADRVMVWCGLWKDRLFGPYFFYGNVTSDMYLSVLKELMAHLNIFGSRPAWFMQDGAPPHYSLEMRRCLNQTFPGHWIGRRGLVELAPRSPDLNPLDFSIWGYLKAIKCTR